MTKDAAVAGERPQGSFGTRRNSIDGFNTYEFAGGIIYDGALYTMYIDNQVLRKYRDKEKEHARGVRRVGWRK